MVAFASEVKQVLALLGTTYRLNEEALGQFEEAEDQRFEATFASGIFAVLLNGQVCASPGALA